MLLNLKTNTKGYGILLLEIFDYSFEWLEWRS